MVFCPAQHILEVYVTPFTKITIEATLSCTNMAVIFCFLFILFEGDIVTWNSIVEQYSLHTLCVSQCFSNVEQCSEAFYCRTKVWQHEFALISSLISSFFFLLPFCIYLLLIIRDGWYQLPYPCNIKPHMKTQFINRIKANRWSQWLTLEQLKLWVPLCSSSYMYFRLVVYSNDPWFCVDQ